MGASPRVVVMYSWLFRTWGKLGADVIVQQAAIVVASHAIVNLSVRSQSPHNTNRIGHRLFYSCSFVRIQKPAYLNGIGLFRNLTQGFTGKLWPEYFG